MKFRALIMNNFRCWDELILENLSNYNALIGENSLGKSSILIGLYISLTGQEFSNEMVQRERLNSRIILRIELSEDDIKLIMSELPAKIGEIDENIYNYFYSKNEIWGIVGWEVNMSHNSNNVTTPSGNSSLLLALPKNDIKKDLDDKKSYIRYFSDWFRNNWPHSGNPGRDKVDNFVANLGAIIGNYIPKQIIRITARRNLKQENTSQSYRYSNFFDGSDLKRMLHDAKNSGDQQRVQGFKHFQDLVESWSFTPGKPDIIARAGEEIDLIFWKEDQTSIRIGEVGDGVKEAVLIAGVCLTYPEKVFLIEEPELHLHPRALRELRDLLKHEIKGQVFISTHSPTFINELDEDTSAIKVLKKGDILQAVTISGKEEFNKFKQEYGLLNSDFLFEDSLIFVEGYSDRLTFESWFELLFPSNHSIRFIAVGGESQIKPALILSVMLQLQQNFGIFSITDSDKISPEEKKEEILNDLQGRFPHLVKDMGEESIKDNIYVLNKRNLESYFDNSPRLIAEWLDIEEERVSRTLKELRGSADRKLKILAKQHHTGFKKVRDLPKLASIMRKAEIDPEIQRLLSNIQSYGEK